MNNIINRLIKPPLLPPFITISAFTLIYYLPIIIKPALIIEKSNDLEEFFWPTIYYVKNQILTFHILPLWNYLFLSGSPLISDPQSPIFYPPNIIFLAMPLNFGFIISIIMHSIFGGFGAYLCAKKGFKFQSLPSLLVSLIYIITPRLAGYLEAGHYGLIISFAWFPYLILAAIKLTSFNIYWLILFVLSQAAIFLNHPLTFAIISPFVQGNGVF